MILKTLQISQVPGGGQQERRIGGGFMQKPERPQNSAWLQLQYHATYLLLWYHAISAMISYSASKDIVSQTQRVVGGKLKDLGCLVTHQNYGVGHNSQ